jgi:hypothetical protein
MAYRIAGIDIHKKMIAVAIADVEVADPWQFERRQLATTPNQLRALAEWLVEREVDEVVMESTAQGDLASGRVAPRSTALAPDAACRRHEQNIIHRDLSPRISRCVRTARSRCWTSVWRKRWSRPAL